MKASLTLEEAKKRNETADSRVIGVAIETRPDWINEEEIIRISEDMETSNQYEQRDF